MLFENAREKGAECLDETRVITVDLRPRESAPTATADFGRRYALRLRAESWWTRAARSALLANRFGLREENQQLRKASIWTYYRGAERCQDPNQNTTIILHTSDKQAWFWYIPLSNDIVSVGVVSDNDYLLKGRGTPEAILRRGTGQMPGRPRARGECRAAGQVPCRKGILLHNSPARRRRMGADWRRLRVHRSDLFIRRVSWH